jgi:hypothetical protein
MLEIFELVRFLDSRNPVDREFFFAKKYDDATEMRSATHILGSVEYQLNLIPQTRLVQIRKFNSNRVQMQQYFVSLAYKTCTCIQFWKKESCKHLLAAFCHVGLHIELLIGDLRPVVTINRGGTRIPTKRANGRPANQPAGALNDGSVRKRGRGRRI